MQTIFNISIHYWKLSIILRISLNIPQETLGILPRTEVPIPGTYPQVLPQQTTQKNPQENLHLIFQFNIANWHIKTSFIYILSNSRSKNENLVSYLHIRLSYVSHTHLEIKYLDLKHSITPPMQNEGLGSMSLYICHQNISSFIYKHNQKLSNFLRIYLRFQVNIPQETCFLRSLQRIQVPR